MPLPDPVFSSVEHLRAVIETPGAIILVIDRRGCIVSFNRGAERLLKSRRRSWIGQNVRKLFANPAHDRKVTNLLRRHGEVLNFETAARAADGKRIPITLNVTRLLDASGRPYGTVAVAADIRRRVRLARELRAKTQHLSDIVEHSPAMIITTDIGGHITGFNPAAEQTLGYAAAQIIGQSAEVLYVDPAQRRRILQRLERSSRVLDAEVRIRTRGGDVLDVATSMSVIRDEEGQTLGTVGICRDITERKRLERELDRISRTDPLTGLWNRRQFFETLRRYLPASGRSTPLSMLYLDVDRFKQLNDRKGHLAGDDALNDLATRLRALLPGPETLAFRYGGDEFIALLPGTDVAQAMLQAEKIRRTYARTHPGGPTVSIGVTQLRRRDRERDLIARADQAMYVAKRSGGNLVEVLR